MNTKNLSLGEAIEQLKLSNTKIVRPSWNYDEYITLFENDNTKIIVKISEDTIYNWNPSTEEMFAEDYIVIE